MVVILTLFKEEKGQSIVEFAIILPFILLLLMGILEFGLIFNSYLTIQNASREGARLGIVGATDTEIQQHITNIAPNLDNNKLTLNIEPIQTARKSGDTITVKVTYDYSVNVPIISNIINNIVVLKTETSMRIE